MWARNLLFAVLCIAGLAALGASLRPVPPRELPDLSPREVDFDAALSELNRVFRDDWAARRIDPAPPAPMWLVTRRLALALMGTVPSLEELRRLEAIDNDQLGDDARLDVWLEHILRDPRCHDYLAERLARAFVGTKDGPFILYRRRRFVDWLSDQLAANRPYDQVVRELLAADGLWTDRPATNFVTVTIKPDGNPKQPNESELAARVSRALLGVRIDCAECHDHPFQPWKQADFQGLAAFFGGTRMTFQGLRDTRGPYLVEDRNTGEKKTLAACVPFDAELLPSESESGNLRQRLSRWVTDPSNERFGLAITNRLWALMLGRGLVEPIDDIRAADELPPVLKILAQDFSAHAFDLRRLVRLIAASEPFRLDSRGAEENSGEQISPEHEQAWAVFPITRLRPEQVAGGIAQASQLTTLDRQSHLVFRFARYVEHNRFIERYGDMGEDEMLDPGGTIPQRLLMLNGNMLADKTKDNPLLNACSHLAMFAPDDDAAIDVAYRAVLTRQPTTAEREHFVGQLRSLRGNQRRRRIEDLYWSLFNATEFSWNH